MLETYDSFQWYDYVIFTVTLLISLGIGVYYAMTGGKQRTTKEFHMADRSMSIIPVALSVYVSNISGMCPTMYPNFRLYGYISIY